MIVELLVRNIKFLKNIIDRGCVKMNWNTISNIASVATLLLFIIYFVGRFWYIAQVKNEIDEVLDREPSDDLKIIEEFDIGNNRCEKVFLTAEKTLLSVKIYKCKFLKEKGKIKKVNC